MKKNKIMRLASVLLVAVLLSTCAISGTFAKYTTSTTSTDKARVAYWGWNKTADINITDLFKNAYDSTVNSTVDVIAPGTTNSATFAFNYDANGDIIAPEVKYTFAIDTTGSSCYSTIKSNANIQWRLNVTEGETETEGTWGTWDELITAINDLDGTGTFEAGTLPEAFDNDQIYEIEWQWVFSTDDAADATDTSMGNTPIVPVTISIKVTATQVD